MRRMHIWYDRQPEPKRFLMFFGPMFVFTVLVTFAPLPLAVTAWVIVFGVAVSRVRFLYFQ